MGYLNQIKRITDSAHLNWMAGPSYNIKDPILNLRLAASSSFFGEPAYYPQDGTDKRPKKQSDRPRPQRRLSPSEVDYLRSTLDAIDPQEWRGMSPKEMMESAIDAALKCREDIKDYLKKNAHRLPPPLRRRLAHLLGCYSRDEVIQFIDEMARQQAPNGGPITLMPLITEKHVCRRDLDTLLREMARKSEKLPCGCVPLTGLTEKAGPSISEEEYDALKPELQCIL